MGFTKNQLQAINERDKNILVSAAAGSGKTTVLAERIINKIINDKIDVDRLLVVTFTKDAAEEMKERITKRINIELQKDDTLAEQLVRINKAQISTIDSFCSKVVKTHFKSLDIDPNFRIGDKGELDILTDEALQNFLDKYYEENKEDFVRLVDSFTKGANDDKFKSVFLNLYFKSQNLPYPKKWLEKAYKQFDVVTQDDFFSSDIFKKLMNYIEEILKEVIIICERIKFISTGQLDFDKNGGNTSTMEGFLTQEFSNFYNMLGYIKEEKYDAFIDSIYNLKYARWNKNLLKANPDLAEEIKSLRDLYKDFIKKEIVEKFFNNSILEIIEDIKTIYPIINTLCNLIIEFDDYFMGIKKEKNIYTFSDIAHFCLNILVEDNKPTNIANQYKHIFDEIIIDEYQDSNSIQETILSSISNNNRFMVGDIKQCIYRFRQANPSIFNEKYIQYFNEKSKDKRIDLNANFRSNKSVIDSINIIFENIMCDKLGEVNYDENARLYNEAIFPNPKENENVLNKCELNIIDCSKVIDEINDNVICEIANTEIEANFICKKINELFSNNTMVFDKDINIYRKIEYKDIVILMRSKSNFDIFADILAKNNIPVYTETSNGFYDFTEIKTIINILNVLVNPLQDYALIGTMYSPIFNFSSNELLEIKLSSNNKLFYYILIDFVQNSDNEVLKNKCLSFLDKIKNWQSLSKSLSINELLSYIYEDSNYYNYLGLLDSGNIRQANLYSLLEKALSFEETNLHGLFNFINYINKFKMVSDDGKASILSKNENVVKIMTIHKSKGLEFPIVFLSNLSKIFNTSDNKEPILFDEQYMFGLSIFNSTSEYEPRKRISSIQKSIIAYKNKEESYSEEMRILYVALTRAKECLILTGCINKNFDETLEKMKNLILPQVKCILPRYFLKSGISNNYLAWVYTAIKNFDVNNIWQVNVSTYEDILNNKTYSNVKDKVSMDKLEMFYSLINLDKNKNYTNNKDEIYKNLSWKYPNMIAQGLTSTLAVSEIKRVYQTKFLDYLKVYDNTNFTLPKFYTFAKEELTPMEVGSIYHKILENIDFNIKSEKELDNLLNNLSYKNILNDKEIECIDKNIVLGFLNTDLVRRINNAKNIKRECAFTLGVKPKDIYIDDEFKSIDNNILVSGIIDLYFEEEDGLVLVDYKTDRTKSERVLLNRYKTQLEIYKRALEQSTCKKVKECVIYSILHNISIII
ncbi:helicase-exonuclease AddAB subunit AddA [uncultured Tyzzerella sp.]|uniref:helicase-exonuclease AddAB subunit AddA n=1 Tax=uncultured Tyzzerella sp. TaxID=2321398 RepID=UPI00294337B2|nr:helicase-exonuclease AddAB subunit AddA [uncultured Tyzzerella sp.]